MCIYTNRRYNPCWCSDYYVKFSNRCEKSLRSASGEPCPQPTDPSILSSLEKEEFGYCDWHLKVKEAEYLAKGIPNPAYNQAEEGALRKTDTIANTRYSDPNPEGKDKQGEGLGIRTSNTFPQSPSPETSHRRSDPNLEVVPNPFHLPAKQLQRSKIPAQRPSQPPDPNPQPVEVPNPWHPQNLQRSKTSEQVTNRPSHPDPQLQHLQRSKTTALPPSRAQNTGPTPQYIPITTQHLLGAKTTTLSPLRGTKPVQVAIRDSNGFFISPEALQRKGEEEEFRRRSTNAPLSPPPPLSDRAFQNPSTLRNADPSLASPHRARPGSGSGSGSGLAVDGDPLSHTEAREEARTLREVTQRKGKCNRVSFVCGKPDVALAGGIPHKADPDLYPRPLQPRPAQDPQQTGFGEGGWRVSGVLKWMGGIGQGQDVEVDEELRTNYVSSDEEGGVKMLDRNRYGGGGEGMPQLQPHTRPRQDPAPAPARRSRMPGERRKSERRASNLEQIQGKAGMSDEDEVLYSGDEYQTEYEYGEGVQRAETEISHARAMQPQPQPQKPAWQVREEGKERQGHGRDTGGVAVEEEEELYSDGEYETDYRDSDDD